MRVSDARRSARRRSLATALAICLAALAPRALTAQVDIESQRPDDDELGFSGSIGFDFSQYSGNVDAVSFTVDSRTDVVRERSRFFALGELQQYWEGGVQYLDEGLLHLREVRRTDRRLRWEVFGQVDFNTPRRLDLRWLAGGGIRVALAKPGREGGGEEDSAQPSEEVGERGGEPGETPGGERREEPTWSRSRFWYGTSLFFEHEDLDLGAGAAHPATTDVVRWSSYLTARGGAKPLTWSWTTYVQPRVDDLDDYRVLSNATLTVTLSARLDWSFSVGGRYDSGPPDGVKKTDSSIESGLVIRWKGKREAEKGEVAPGEG